MKILNNYIEGLLSYLGKKDVSKTMLNNKGFTIVEVLVVVVLIVILSAIAIPSYTYYKEKARKGVVTALLYSAQRAADVSHATGDRLTKSRLLSSLKSKVLSKNLVDLEYKTRATDKWCIGAVVKTTGEYGQEGDALGCIDQDGEIDDLAFACELSGSDAGRCVDADGNPRHLGSSNPGVGNPNPGQGGVGSNPPGNGNGNQNGNGQQPDDEDEDDDEEEED